MRRRDFLKTTLVAAGGALLLPGCGSEDAADSKEALQIVPGHAYFPQSVASGDPKPTSVILWTRTIDPAATTASELTLKLQVATDAAFTQLITLGDADHQVIKADKAFDFCVKARVVGLQAATTYYYRFLYAMGETHHSSRTGTTRTAPALDADVPVRFAYVSCQDFNGKYYNTYRRLAGEEVDFWVHLGDYIYETTGNKSFQDSSPDRAVKFGDEAGAIAFNTGTDDAYFAAKSLDNYRDLYRIYRGDADLQAMHEKAPMIVIWDDHEFTDDCWGTEGTYFDGASDENDPTRRRDADQAWFEYMPVDYMGEPDFTFDASKGLEQRLRIYRDFHFGKNLHLIMTDLRRYRSDHIVPEDAFPGAMALTQPEIEAVAGKVPDWAAPYIDIEAYEGGKFKTLMQKAAKKVGWFEESDIQGLVNADWVNLRIADLNEGVATAEQTPPLTATELAKMKRGLGWHQLMKTARHSSIGSRYLVVEDGFLLLAKHLYTQSKGKSELVLGDTQRKWFIETMTGSKATWKVWGNEFTLTSRVADLRPFSSLPPAFQARFLLSAEDWDGVPNRRDHLLNAIADVDNVVAITGDIHAFFAGMPAPSDKPEANIVEFVTGAISSSSYKTMLTRTASADPALDAAGAPALALIAEDILLGGFADDPGKKPNPTLAYAALDKMGFAVVDVDADKLQTTYFGVDGEHAKTHLGVGPGLNDKFSTTTFRVAAGQRTLQMQTGSTWKTWDVTAAEWK